MRAGGQVAVHNGQVRRPQHRVPLPRPPALLAARGPDQDVCEAAAGEELGDERAGRALDAGAEEAHDVGVTQLGQHGQAGSAPLVFGGTQRLGRPQGLRIRVGWQWAIETRPWAAMGN